MSLKICLPGMVERGEISQDQADYMAAVYDQIEAKYRKETGEATAAALASRDTIAQLEAETFQKKRQAVLQMAAQRSALDNMKKYKGGKVGHAAMALLDADGKAPYSNVEARRKAILGRAHAMMEGILARHRRRVTGQVRDPATLKDIVRELFGQDTGNLAAKELADAWKRTAEMLRLRFNAAGGVIGKLENWGMPQTHNSVKLRKVGYKTWRDFIAPRLDVSKMVDGAGKPLTDEALENTLKHVFETIRTQGWYDRIPGPGGGKKLANRRADSRFLIFRDADSWLEYQEQYGASSPFDAMMGHISGMSRDVAMMEILGPNPNASIKWLQDVVTKDTALGDGVTADGAKGSVKRIQELYDTISGAANAPVNERVAAWGQGVRSLLTSALLGSTTLSASTDVSFQAVTRRFNGLPVVGAVTGYLKLLRPYMSKDQKLAIRLGLIAEEASKMASAQNRYLGEAVGPELASRLADGVLRISGLSPWTQAGRWAFGMETLGVLADNADKPFSKLNPRFRGMLERYGIGSDEWTKIRQTPLYEERGATFLRPADVRDQVLGDRLLEMISTEVNFAVPTATVRARSIMNIGEPGTIKGEIGKSALMFKSFPISMILTHGRRMVEQTPWNAFKYAAALSVSTTLVGALALQMKEISKGRDPRPMADPKFWWAAMLQGGGLGIFGDFIGSTENRYGGGLAQTAAGPMVGFVSDVGAIPWEFTKEEEDRRLGRKSLDLARRYVPGSSLWYARAAYERMMMDQIQQEIDPDYWESWDRMESYAERQGQDYWWEPGEVTPERAPDTSKLMEAMPE